MTNSKVLTVGVDALLVGGRKGVATFSASDDGKRVSVAVATDDGGGMGTFSIERRELVRIARVFDANSDAPTERKTHGGHVSKGIDAEDREVG
jgi:hypothetical protein